MDKKHAQKMAKILTRAVKHINRGWTTGAEARNADRTDDNQGEECPVTDKEACRFCAIGAVKVAIHDVNKKYDFSLFTDINERLCDEVKRSTNYVEAGPHNSYISKGYATVENFNDLYAKDKRYVIRLFNRVIAGLKAGA